LKRTPKILFISGSVLIVIVVILFFFTRWLEDYSVEMSDEAALPEPMETLPSVEADSTGWPSWKGLFNNNHAAFTHIKTDWSAGLVLLWKVDYLCKGDKSIAWSCPVISGNHLVVPGRRDSTEYIFCLDPQSGRLLWKHSYENNPGNASYGEGPRATPTIDGDRVFVLSRGGLLQCLNLMDGSVIWKRDYLTMGAEMPKWGFAGSPVLFGNTLIVHVGGEALVYGLDKMTGETHWKSKAAPASYSTPVIIKNDEKDLLLVLGGQTFFILDPFTGSTIWQIPWEMENNINICTPVYSAAYKIALISAWYKKGTGAIKIGEENSRLLWHSKSLNAHQIDPIVLDDHVYGFSGMSAHNRNDIMCLDMKTGEQMWASKELGSGQFIYIEPYFLSVDLKGSLYLSLPSPEGLNVVSKIENLIGTDNARFWTKPVVAQGNLYLRYANQLYCYRLAKL